MTSNPLVVAPTQPSALAGTFLLQDVEELVTALRDESWLDAALAGVSGVLDAVATVSDPLGSLFAAGLGWIMEHLEPLKGWLDDLTGDPGAVEGFAGTWDNIARQMTTVADDLDAAVARDLESLTGAALTAYAGFQKDLGAHVRGVSDAATGVASSLRTCAMIVTLVHELVRDALAEVAGAVVSYAAELVLTLGLATPLVIEQAATRVAALATRVGTKVAGVVASAKNLKALMSSLRGALETLAKHLRGVRPDTPTAPRPPDFPMSTGGRIRPRPTSDVRAWEWADDVYDTLRADTGLVDDLARHNPDLSREQLDQIRRHVLDEEHLLDDGPARFDADPDMSEAFLRLRAGEGTPTDRLLLQHELAESQYVREHPGATYREAHAHANGVANWEDAVRTERGRR